MSGEILKEIKKIRERYAAEDLKITDKEILDMTPGFIGNIAIAPLTKKAKREIDKNGLDKYFASLTK